MPKQNPDRLITTAEAAVKYAQAVREHHRFRSKRGNAKREADISIALGRLKSAMEPLRSAVGRMQFEKPSTARRKLYEKYRSASADLQRERRKLWKMQDRSENI